MPATGQPHRITRTEFLVSYTAAAKEYAQNVYPSFWRMLNRFQIIPTFGDLHVSPHAWVDDRWREWIGFLSSDKTSRQHPDCTRRN